MGTGLLLLSAYVLLALALLVNWGFYHPMALAMLLSSFTLLVIAFVWVSRSSTRDRRVPGTRVFAAALMGLLLAGLAKPTAMYLQSASYNRTYHLWLLVFTVLIAVGYLLGRPEARAVRRAVFAIGVLAAVAFRLWMPLASPAPVIDTFSIGQEASQSLLLGKNPYTTPVSDIYQGQADLGYELEAYDYLPANLHLQLLSYVATRDVRYANVIAEIAVALMIWRLARRRWGESTAECISLLFLYNPRSLFVIEQGWLDPLILVFFALFLVLRDCQRPFAASLSYGYMLFLKQYMAFALIQWLLIERNWRRIAAGLCLGVLTVAPYVLLDWGAFVDNAVLFSLRVPFRDSSLTVFSLLHRMWGLRPPGGWAVIVGAILTVITWIPQRNIQPLRGYLFAVTITLFGMFLFGSAGFCNWYYLVCGLLLCLIAAGGRRRPADVSLTLDSVGFAAI